MKKLGTISMIAVCLLTSCNNNDSKSGPVVPPKSTEEVFTEAAEKGVNDYSQIVPPNSFTVVKPNINFDEKIDQYDLGCKAPGSFESAQQMDPLLKPEMVFVREHGSQTLTEKADHSRYEYTAKSISAKKLIYHHNFEWLDKNQMGPFTSMDQIFSSKPHAIYTVEWTKTQDGYMRPNVDMTDWKWTQAALNFMAANEDHDPSYVSCGFDYTTSAADQKNSVEESKILYTINGKTVPAILRKSINDNVNIYCEKNLHSQNDPKTQTRIQLGKGRHETITITTNGIVSLMGNLTCGGENIYESSKTVLANGNVVESWVSKTSTAPIRK